MAFAVLLLLAANCHCVQAQEGNDSLAYDFRSFVARNFSRHRTMNFNYETTASHNITLTAADGNAIEKGRRQDIHVMRFSTMAPLLKKRKASLYASFQYASYCFQGSEHQPSTVFHERANDHFAGGFAGSFYTNLFGRPVVLSANVSADASKHDLGKIYGSISAMTVLKTSQNTAFTLGLFGMTLYNSIPVLPLIAYWHRFSNPDWSVDITLPSQIFLRYQFRNQRLSAGMSMGSNGFYLRPAVETLPKVCYYSESAFKPGLCYEFIINRHFYLSVSAGLSIPLKAGLYTKSRKGIDSSGNIGGSDPLIKLSRQAQPCFSMGLSYSLFK